MKSTRNVSFAAAGLPAHVFAQSPRVGSLSGEHDDANWGTRTPLRGELAHATTAEALTGDFTVSGWEQAFQQFNVPVAEATPAASAAVERE